MNIDDWTGTDISDDIIEEAAYWVAALDAENADEPLLVMASVSAVADIELPFYVWLNQDPVHQMAFAQVSELWAKTACLKHVEHLLEPSQVLAYPRRFAKSAKASNQGIISDAPLLQDQRIETASPSWAYNLVIGIISFGFVVSFVPL
jgi:ferric-dicitrate binding protein FerR (iron transport regulator)